MPTRGYSDNFQYGPGFRPVFELQGSLLSGKYVLVTHIVAHGFVSPPASIIVTPWFESILENAPSIPNTPMLPVTGATSAHTEGRRLDVTNWLGDGWHMQTVTGFQWVFDTPMKLFTDNCLRVQIQPDGDPPPAIEGAISFVLEEPLV